MIPAKKDKLVTLFFNYSMEILVAVVGITAIVWISIGIIVHADWILRIFRIESGLITNRQLVMQKHGSRTFPIPESLSSKNVFVFGYWGDRSLVDQNGEKSGNSPLVFRYANLALVTSTSIFVLIILGKGLFATLNLI